MPTPIGKRTANIWAVLETTEGTTPNDAAFTRLRFSADAHAPQATSEEDPTIRNSRFADNVQRLSAINRGAITCPFREDAGIDLLLEAQFGNAWQSNILAAGNVQKWLTIYKRFGASTYLRRFTGQLVSGWTLTVPANQRASIAFEIQGGAFPLGTVPPGTPTLPTNGSPLDTLPMLGRHVTWEFLGNLSAYGSASCINSAVLTATSNVEPIECLGVDGEGQSVDGLHGLSGQFRMMFQDSDVFNAFRDDATFGFSLTLTDPAGEASYVFATPADAVRIAGVSEPLEGNNGSVFSDVQWAGHEGSGNLNCTITRTAS